MIEIFYGTDHEACQQAIRARLQEYQKKGYGDGAVHFSPETNTEEEILNNLLGNDLFNTQNIFILRGILKTASPELLEAIFSLADSETKYIICREDTLNASLQARSKKLGLLIQEYKRPQAKDQSIFKLSDALGVRNKKDIWIQYRELLDGGSSPHAILGIVWWQVKNMLMVLQSSDNPGLAPFVYTKTKKALQKYSLEELRHKAKSIVSIYHRARTGDDIELLLERFLLDIEKKY